MVPDPNFLSEEEAARLWQRAAQLQAEAVDRAEALAGEPEVEDTDEGSAEGYALAHVRSAALEAGISVEFMDAALTDLRAERALPKGKRGWSLARRILKHPPDTITVRRVIEASAAEVLSAMQAVFPQEPFRLTLVDQRGDPLSGGLLVFDIQGLGPFALELKGLARDASWSGLRQVFVSLRAIEGAEASCEVTLHGPVAWSPGMDFAQSLFVTGASGGLGFGLGAAGGSAVGALGIALGLGPAGAVLATLVAVGGVVMGGGLGVKGYRALYAFGIGRGRKALHGLLGAVAGRAQSGWGISQVGPGEPPLRLPGASNSTD